MSRYVGNEGFTMDFSKVLATFESNGALKVVLDSGNIIGFDMTAQQTLDVIKFHKEYLIGLEK